jgi:hypothetical protein
MSEFVKRMIGNTFKQVPKEVVMKNLAKDFGFLMGDAVKKGFSREIAFESARQHFTLYGKSMVEFSESVTYEWLTERK